MSGFHQHQQAATAGSVEYKFAGSGSDTSSTNFFSAVGGLLLSFVRSKSSARDVRFFSIVLGVFVFFGLHNFMQELIMSLPGFETGIFLGYLEMLGVTVCALAERYYAGELHHAMKGKFLDYWALCALLLTSSGTSNLALGHINYPTKVVFRSCKLVPTMVVAVLVNRRNVQTYQFITGGLISLGMVLFAAADFQAYPQYTAYGITLVSISVVADAFLPNLQERVFERGASRTEVSLCTNALSFFVMTLYLAYTGDLGTGVSFAFSSTQHLLIMGAYTLLAYVAINFHMSLVQEFGGISAVIVGNTRKAMTIGLSFLFFPKPFSMLYVLGGVLVFGSLIWSDMMKERLKREQKQQQLHSGGNSSRGTSKEQAHGLLGRTSRKDSSADLRNDDDEDGEGEEGRLLQPNSRDSKGCGGDRADYEIDSEHDSQSIAAAELGRGCGSLGSSPSAEADHAHSTLHHIPPNHNSNSNNSSPSSLLFGFGKHRGGSGSGGRNYSVLTSGRSSGQTSSNSSSDNECERGTALRKLQESPGARKIAQELAERMQSSTGEARSGGKPLLSAPYTHSGSIGAIRARLNSSEGGSNE